MESEEFCNIDDVYYQANKPLSDFFSTGFEFFFFFFLESEIIQQEVKKGRGDVVVVSDLERFEKIKAQEKWKRRE